MISSGILTVLVSAAIATSSPQATDIQEKGDEKTPPTNYQANTSPHPSAVPEQSREERKEENNNKSARKPAVLEWCERYQTVINLASAIAVAVFTGVLTFYSVRLWRSGERHSERELRAYVSITDAMIKASTDPEKHLLKAQITVQNAGQTPAYDLNVIATFDCCEFPRANFPRHTIDIQSRSTLGPGAEVIVMRVYDKLTPEDSAAVSAEQFAFFFCGRIEYRDAFKKDRFTEFRYIAVNDKTGFLTWQVTEGGNEST